MNDTTTIKPTAVTTNVRTRFKRWKLEMLAADPHCRYCGCPMTRPTMDHVVPLSKGGSNARSNCVLSCSACNYWKRAKSPAEMVAVLRRMLAVLEPFVEREGEVIL